jgi:hypothetical protein
MVRANSTIFRPTHVAVVTQNLQRRIVWKAIPFQPKIKGIPDTMVFPILPNMIQGQKADV